MQGSKTALALCALLVVSGCSWVSLTQGGAVVQLIDADEAKPCKEVGRTRAHTTAKIGPFSRTNQQVFKEQSRLARNEAARMGGNAVVAVGDPDPDGREFIVYRCPED